MVNMWQPVSFGGGQSGGMFGVSGSAGGSQAVPGAGAMEGILKLAEALMKRGAQQGQMANFQEAMKAYEGWKPPEGEAIYHGPLPNYGAIPESINPGERKLLEYHRSNLDQGKYLDDDKGLTTVNIMGVTGPDGRIYNVPGYADGKRLSPEEARQRAAQIGWKNFPSYGTGEESNEAARRLHGTIEQDSAIFRANKTPVSIAGRDTRLGGGLNAMASVLANNPNNLKIAQDLMLAKMKADMKPQSGFTLGEGQVRYNASGKPVAKGPEKAKFREIDMPIDNDKRQRLVSYDDGKTWQKFGTPFSTRDPFIIQESVDENGNMIRQAFPREAVAAQMAAGMASPRGKGAESPATDPVVPGQQMGGVVLGTKPNPNVFKPLPSAEIENYQQALQAWRSLKTMESTIDVTGRVRGLQSKTEAFLGTDKRAVDFETARNNFRLSAQALIKGIPSNFDVQTVIETLPSLTIAETSNRSRLDFAKQSFKDLVEGSIAYYKSLGYRSPAFVDKLAKEMDIDASKVEPWDRKGDPLQKAIDRMGKSKENDPLGIR